MSDMIQIVGPRTVQLVRTLQAPIDVVWRHLTDPDLRALWFAGGPIEPRAGGSLTLTFRHSQLSDGPTPERFQKYEGMVETATITRWEPPRVFGFLFGGEGAEAVFELEPLGQTTRLTLTHSQLAGRSAMVNVSGGWTAHVGLLEDIVAGRPHRDFWGEVAAAEAEAERIIPQSP